MNWSRVLTCTVTCNSKYVICTGLEFFISVLEPCINNSNKLVEYSHKHIPQQCSNYKIKHVDIYNKKSSTITCQIDSSINRFEKSQFEFSAGHL